MISVFDRVENIVGKGEHVGSFTETNDSAAESAEQDQTTRMCRLVLFYTFRKINTMVSNSSIRIKHEMRRVVKSLLNDKFFYTDQIESFCRRQIY